jgi:hypothetical protein
MKIILVCFYLVVQTGQFVSDKTASGLSFAPSQTLPLTGPEVFHQIYMEWFQKLQNQPGGINPGTPPDSRPGRVSCYS